MQNPMVTVVAAESRKPVLLVCGPAIATKAAIPIVTVAASAEPVALADVCMADVTTDAIQDVTRGVTLVAKPDAVAVALAASFVADALAVVAAADVEHPAATAHASGTPRTAVLQRVAPDAANFLVADFAVGKPVAVAMTVAKILATAAVDCSANAE